MARILVIDDEELARFTLREILETAGHEVSEAKNGNEGIAFQKAQPFDLVVTDIIMPEKEGIETIIEMKQDFPGLKIIGISGCVRAKNFDFFKMAMQFGAEMVLEKPFTEDGLMECVNACLPG